MEQFRIVFHDEQGNLIDHDDLRDVSGKIGYRIVSDREVTPEAQRFHDQGRAAGQRGEHDRAIELFARAAELEPDWPYPHYDTAFTCLLKGDARTAEEHYREVDRLAPRGFFIAKVAVDSLRRERQGELSPGAYLAFVMLEWESDPEKQRSALEALLRDNPTFPPAWKMLALTKPDPVERLQAIEHGLGLSPDAETRGDLLIHKASVLSQSGRREEAHATLQRVSADPECTIRNGAVATILSAQLTDQEQCN